MLISTIKSIRIYDQVEYIPGQDNDPIYDHVDFRIHDDVGWSIKDREK
jgi:hypothetical protein